MSSMSDEEIITRFVDQLHEEFDKSWSERDAAEREHRRHSRKKCDSTRMVAHWDGETPVSMSDFQPILCHDVGSGGLSFWANEKPNSKYFIVQLQVDAEIVYLKFRVAHATPEFARGRPAYIVGCEFIGRLDRNAEGYSVSENNAVNREESDSSDSQSSVSAPLPVNFQETG